MDFYQYKIYCETESDWIHKWMSEDEGALSVCPNNTSHTVTSGSVVITDTILGKGPTMSDGRPIVMANSRPIGYQTMFTMVGDTASGIGDGKEILWDFSNDYDLMASGVAPAGYKGKSICIEFLDGVYVKEGTLYFHSAKKGSYVNFDIVCPDGQYYYDRDLNPVQADGDVVVVRYVNRHYFYGDCPMGDELNTESATDNAIPANYHLCVSIFVPESDTDSYGYGELELYRERTILLPGETP